MTEDELRQHAEDFVRVAKEHSLCTSVSLLSVDADRALLTATLKVEMPLAEAAEGISATGVRVEEEVRISLWGDYPWSCPTFALREDFPRHFPHLSSRAGKGRPVPCLVEGSAGEYFTSWGLLEVGILQILSQMGAWFAKAATHSLMDPTQGWEPVIRHDVDDVLISDPLAMLGRINNKPGDILLRTRFVKQRTSDSWDTTMIASDDLAPAVSTTLARSPFNVEQADENLIVGDTVTALFWPAGRLESAAVLPETIENLDDLAARADVLGLGWRFKKFVERLEEFWSRTEAPVEFPVCVVLCFRRPYNLIGRDYAIEMLPYTFEISPAPRRKSLFAGPTGRRVRPAKQIDKLTSALLRSVSQTPDLGSYAVVGCGSVGSKMTMHLARAGAQITAISDNRCLFPHNMARHALARFPFLQPKALELEKEIVRLGQNPCVCLDDVAATIRSGGDLSNIVPPSTKTLLNTTASLVVRESLSLVPRESIQARMAEVALFGRGRGAFVLHEGANRNPSLADLEVALGAYATADERKLLFDPAFGLTEVQIGDGCGSLTMPTTDMRLSAMTALATEHLTGIVQADASEGTIAIGVDTEAGVTTWRRLAVPEMLEVKVEGSGWRLRVAAEVVMTMRAEIARYPGEEAGGLLIGACSGRTRTITVVDVLDAPPDSTRSPTKFVLGKKGLKAAIKKRYNVSGKRLIDVGTWHSHLVEVGPSATDRQTAKQLARERPPPAVLLIITPTTFHALIHNSASA